MQHAKCFTVAVLATLANGLAFAQSPQITRVSLRVDGRQIAVPSGGAFGAGGVSSVSDDGRFVVINETYPLGPLAVGLTRLLDRVTGVQTLPLTWPGQALPDTYATNVLVSGDGSKLVATSYASGIPGGPTINRGTIYLIDRASAAFTCITTVVGSYPTSTSGAVDISTDGRFVLYESYASNLVAGDTNGDADVYLFDALSSQTTRVSVSTGGTQSALGAAARMVTDDGRFALFSFFGDDMAPGDTNHNEDVFVRDLQLGTTELISVTPGGTTGDDLSRPTWISPDGRFVIFYSVATNLVPGDNNNTTDFFLRDRQLGSTSLITLTNSGAPIDGFSEAGVVPRSGRYLFFSSVSGTVVSGDTNNQMDLFVRDMQAGTTTLLSLTPSGAAMPVQPSNYIWPVSASADGRFFVFNSQLTSLIDGDSNEGIDGFLLDQQSPGFPVTSYCPAKVTSSGCTPIVTSAGFPSAASFDSFFISASQVRAGVRGVLLLSLSSASTPFGGGTLCLGAPTTYAAAVASGAYGGTSGACNQGQFVFKLSQTFLAANGLFSGTTAYAQFISRDNGFAPPDNIGLSDAIRFTVAP